MILGKKRTEIKTNLFIYPNEFEILYRFGIITGHFEKTNDG
jgi:hypothetical protein